MFPTHNIFVQIFSPHKTCSSCTLYLVLYIPVTQICTKCFQFSICNSLLCSACWWVGLIVTYGRAEIHFEKYILRNSFWEIHFEKYSHQTFWRPVRLVTKLSRAHCIFKTNKFLKVKLFWVDIVGCFIIIVSSWPMFIKHCLTTIEKNHWVQNPL